MQSAGQPRDIKSAAAWLKSVFARLDEDIRQLHRVESFWHPCLKCGDGHCCWHESYLASGAAGNPFAPIEWWIALEHVSDNFSAVERKQLARNMLSKRTACVFLFGSRCQVYPARSWISRMHPYSISFFPGKMLSEGEVAVPSCPKYAASFDIKINQLRVLRPNIASRSGDRRLVQVQMPKHKLVWYIDATDYMCEFETYLSHRSAESSGKSREDLLHLAADAGKEQGAIFKKYIETTFRLG